MIMCIGLIPFSRVNAEGSKELTDTDSGNRPYLEYYTSTTSKTANMQRKCIIKTYAKAGEKIYLASSANGAGAIDVVDPNGITKTYEIVKDGEGYIANPTEEDAGPIIAGVNDAGGYNPLLFTATTTGIYEIHFKGVGDSNKGQNPTPIGVNDGFIKQNSDYSTGCGTVAAWDVTVVNRQDKICTGRCFSDCLFLNMGKNGESLNSTVYALTDDGYVYKTNFNGMDPFGFLFYANARGPLYKYVVGSDSIVQSAYHSFMAQDNNLTSINGEAADSNNYLNGSIANVIPYDDNMDNTYILFFNSPSKELVDYLGIDLVTSLGHIREGSFKFSGFSSNKSFVDNGGIFSFDIPTTAGATSFEIRVKLKGSDTYIALSNAIDKTTEHQYVYWDGKDSEGNIVPTGNYTTESFSLMLKAGEIHMPLLDVENNPNGIIIQRQTTAGVYEDSIVHYNNVITNDNRATYAPGISGTINIADGINQSNGDGVKGPAMVFNGNKGNQTLLDIWTNATEELQVDQIAEFDIVPSLAIAKYDSAVINSHTDRDLLGGAEFEIQDNKGAKLYFVPEEYEGANVYRYVEDSSVTGAISTLTSVSAMKINVIEMPGGVYTLKEITAPDGYKKADDITFTIEEHTSKSTSLEVYDDFIPPASRITLKKYSTTDSNRLLAGAKFNVSVSNAAKNGSDDTKLLCFKTFTNNIHSRLTYWWCI